MNKDLMFSSKTELWETPQEFFQKLDDLFNFTLDVCAIAENAKCDNYYSPEDDGLSQPWYGNVWCNPPYGRGIIKWIKKACSEISKNSDLIVMLVPARTDTKWFHDYIYRNPLVEILFIKGRLKFGNSDNPAPFPSMLLVFKKEC